MKKLLSFIFLFTALSSSYSQETKYTGLKSKGEIPTDFTQLTLDKIEEANKQSASGSRKKDKTTQEFNTMTRFGVDQLLQSGNVCFNDTISTYVESVLEEIRSKNRSIPLDIRIYAIKSTVVNAFTTDQGIIFINTGLLAQLENEAQLAFILCHEIVHYTEGHIMEGFMENSDINNDKGDYHRNKTIDKELASSGFSRKLETEADKLGLELFLNTDYNPQEVDGVFDVLLYAYLPFDEIPFDSSFLEVGEYQIPDKFFLTELTPIEIEEDEDDSRHTHPNIAKRRVRADDILIQAKQHGKNFIVSESDFYAVRAAARYEVLRLQLINAHYSEALYSAFILKKEYPENPLPELAIGDILYGTALFANDMDRKKVTGYYKKKQGYSQQAYYLLNKLKAKDLTNLAIRYTYMLTQKYPEEQTVQKRLEDLFTALVYEYDVELADYKFDSPRQKTLHSEPILTVDRKAPQGKYDRIKSKAKSSSKSESTKMDQNWSNKLFAGCNCEEDISDLFQIGLKQSDQLKIQRAETDDPRVNKNSLKTQAKYEKKKSKKGRSLGIDKIVLVDPYYIVYDQITRKENLKLIKSEMEEIEQIEDLEITSKNTELDLTILTYYKFGSDDVTKFNDFSLMNEWISERYLFGNKSKTPSSTEEVQELTDRYGTDYFAWTGVVSTNLHRKRKLGTFTLYGLTLIGLPYSFYYLFTPQRATLIYFAVFNIKTGQLVMYEERELLAKDSDGLIQSHYQDMFNQIKRN